MITPNGKKRCAKRSCEFFNPYMENKCNALVDVYIEDNQCPFYKRKEEKKRK